jgi:biotin transport system substrate-specific component
MNRKKRISTKTIILVGMFTSIIAVLSQIAIPLPSGVPVTLQTFGVALCGFVLGWKLGIASTIIYILVGAMGTPVFHNFTGGLGILVGKTGGFIFGFVFLALFCGISMKIKFKYARIVIALVGVVICHFLGIVQFSLIMDLSFIQSAILVSIPFLLKDIISIAIGYFIAIAVRSRIIAANIF